MLDFVILKFCIDLVIYLAPFILELAFDFNVFQMIAVLTETVKVRRFVSKESVNSQKVRYHETKN